MATAARDRLARTLRGDAKTAFSVELAARTDDLSLAVEGFGSVKFPVTPARARKLLGLGQPARFGRGEETLSDPDVRDTWEIPKHLVRAEWNDGVLKVILATVKEEHRTTERCRTDCGSSFPPGLRAEPVLPRPPGLRERRLDDRHPGGDAAV